MVDSLQPEKVISAVTVNNPFVEDTFQNSTQMEFSLLVCCFVSFFLQPQWTAVVGCTSKPSVRHCTQCFIINLHLLSLWYAVFHLWFFFLMPKISLSIYEENCQHFVQISNIRKICERNKKQTGKKEKITMRKKRGANQRSWCT